LTGTTPVTTAPAEAVDATNRLRTIAFFCMLDRMPDPSLSGPERADAWFELMSDSPPRVKE
jgi:hypothetical protein